MSNFSLGTAVGRIVIDGSQAKSGFGVATVAANAFYSAVEEKIDSVKQLGTNLTRIGTAGSAGLGLAIRSAANFEATLSGVKAVSGATAAEMDLIRKAALRIGKDTVFSAGEAAQAMEELSKAGVSTADILNGAADATVSLAAAGQIDLPQAAEIAANAMNNFALSGKQLPHVADLIAGAANASAIDVSDFGFSLSQAGAVAHLTGLKFDDLSVAIAEMGQAGIKGSDAGTSIKTFLTNLIPTTAQQVGLFRELGLITVKTGQGFANAAKLGIRPLGKSYGQVSFALQKYIAANHGGALGTQKNISAAGKLGQRLQILGNDFFDAQGNMKKFSDIQQILQKATKSMTKEQKLNALQTLFGADAIRASAVFAEQGAKGYDKMAKAMGKVTAADVAATRMDNLNGSIENLKGSFETMMITIGEVFLPFVRKIVDGINRMVNVFNNLPAPMQKAIALLFGLGTAMSLFTGIAIKLLFFLGPMLIRFLGFSALKGIFSIFFEGFNILRAGSGVTAALSGAIARGGVVFTRFAKIGRIMFGVLSRFPALFRIMRITSSLAFGPWGLALVAVGTAAVIAYNKSKPFHDLVVRLADVVKGTLLKGLQQVQLAIHLISRSFEEGDITSNGFHGKLEQIGVIGHIVYSRFIDLVNLFRQRVIPAVKAAGQQIAASLGPAVTEISETFQRKVIPAVKEMQTSFEKLMPVLRQLWTQIQPIAVIIGKVLVVAIVILAVAFFELNKILIGSVLPVLIQIATVVIVATVIAITRFIDIVITLTSWIIKAASVIVTVWVVGWQLLVGAVNTAITAVMNALKSIFNIVVSAIKAVMQAAVDVWRQFWGMFGGIITAYAKLWLLTIELIGLAILVAVTRAMDAVFNFWKGVWNDIYGVVKAVWGAIGPYVTGAANAVWKAIVFVFNAIVKYTKTVWGLYYSYIIKPVAAAVLYINGKLNAMTAALRGAWNSMISSVKNAFSSFFGATSKGTNKAMSPITGIKKRVLAALSGAGGWLKSAGRAIIQGLLDGINAMIGKVQDALANLTDALPSWKGPMDTDKKLLTANGQAIMQSLIDGFNSKSDDIKKTLGDFTASIPQQVTVNQINDATSANNTTDSQRASVSNSNVSVTNNWNVYNPVEEKTSTTTTKAATRRAQLGVLA